MSDEEDLAAPVDAGAALNLLDRRNGANNGSFVATPSSSSTSSTETIEEGTIDTDGSTSADYRVEQYVLGVIDYSSQYGSVYSISYTATNIIGRPTKYPEYGDFPETFAMRTYGNWWKTVPSYVVEIQSQNCPPIPANDFIVVMFEDYTIPDKICIYETFCPGAVVRIWAYTIAKTWFCLWEEDANSFYTRPPCPANRGRKFSPPLNKLQLPTKTIRLEFNHSCLKYFTEIDAVLMCGRNVNVRNTQHIIDYYEQQQKGSISRKLQRIQFRPEFKGNYKRHLQEFLINDLDKFINTRLKETADIECLDTMTTTTSTTTIIAAATLKDMPFEIMLHIFSYLDLISLFRVGQVSRYFHEVSTQPLLYKELNLKPYWNLATTDLLCTLAKRTTLLKKLDLSWCGLYNSISPTEFKKFIQQRGDSLTHLRLNSAKFLNASCIDTLGIACDNLKELTLRNCSTDPPILNFSCLANLKNLERLDLFQTVIEADLLLIMLDSNRRLKHLNLAFCNVAVNMDTVAKQIGNCNKQLVSLDMWKSHFLSAIGLQALSNCHELEEVDFGWCLREATLGNSLKLLLANCPKMRKLFLATMRGITDRDMESIANLCKNLEQLDIMGVLGISKERYHEVLTKCKKLKLLDLSFCDNIDEEEITLWARTFNVHIKCSHVPLDLL